MNSHLQKKKMKLIFGFFGVLFGTSCGFIDINNTFNGSDEPNQAVEVNNTLSTEVKPKAPPEEPQSILGVVTYCDGRQNGAQCYGALGGSVFLQLMDDFLEAYTYQLLTQNMIILAGGKEKPLENEMKTRSSFFPSNGTFLIRNLSRNDSGEYTLYTFDSNGLKAKPSTLQLVIKAPVSPVSLVSECLSQGEMKVSCSSEGGDSPQYRWTLNGKSVTEAELLSGNEQTNIITLKQHVSGRLVCSVWNHVSSASKEINICTCGFERTPCPKPTTIPETVHSGSSALGCSLMFLFSVVCFVGIAVYFKWKKINSEKDEESVEGKRTKFVERFSKNVQVLYNNIQSKS